MTRFQRSIEASVSEAAAKKRKAPAGESWWQRHEGESLETWRSRFQEERVAREPATTAGRFGQASDPTFGGVSAGAVELARGRKRKREAR